MFSPDELRAVRTLVVHDDCADGTASAILLHDALPAAEIVFLEYGTGEHERLAPRPGMLFCDFSPPRARRAEFVHAAAFVLDHHKTTRDVVLGFGARGVFGDERSEPGVSGAVLAFRHVWLPLQKGAVYAEFARQLATVAGVRDTWLRTSPLWHQADVQERVLMFVPREEWLATPLGELALTWNARFDWLGETLVLRARERARRALAGAHRFAIRGGLNVLALDGIELANDAADLSRGEAQLVVAFALAVEAGRQRLRVSLRSDAGFDCGEFAVRFGGGGHTGAAGFSIPLGSEDPQPFALLERLFEETA